MQDDATPLLDVQRMSRRFGGSVANADESISVAQGEIVGLIGPNGAGKSTLFNVIAGSLPASQGTSSSYGADVTAQPTQRAARSGLRGRSRSSRSSRIDDGPRQCRLSVPSFGPAAPTTRAATPTRCSHLPNSTTWADAPAHELTPAEKRRLEVARALATSPKLLLLDEVMTGLTPMEARNGVDLVRRIRDTGSPC